MTPKNFLKNLWLKQNAVKISVSSIVPQFNHMEKKIKSFLSVIRLSIFILSKPASLLNFVDPSLYALCRVGACDRYLPRCSDDRSTG
jgi:hypothetical protein